MSTRPVWSHFSSFFSSLTQTGPTSAPPLHVYVLICSQLCHLNVQQHMKGCARARIRAAYWTHLSCVCDTVIMVQQTVRDGAGEEGSEREREREDPGAGNKTNIRLRVSSDEREKVKSCGRGSRRLSWITNSSPTSSSSLHGKTRRYESPPAIVIMPSTLRTLHVHNLPRLGWFIHF